MPAATKSRKTPTLKSTEKVRASVPGFVLVEVRGRRPPAVPPKDQASKLVQKTAKALSTPGISESVVFTGNRSNGRPVYAYSIDPTDVSRVLRRAADGSIQVGRLVNNQFRRVRSG